MHKNVNSTLFFVDSKLENINYIIRKNSFKKIICNYSFNHRKSTTQVVWGSEKIVTDSGHRWQQKCLIWFELYLRKLHFTFTKKLWIYIFFSLTEFATRRCSPNGFWLNEENIEGPDPSWTNFTGCFTVDVAKVLKSYFNDSSCMYWFLSNF